MRTSSLLLAMLAISMVIPFSHAIPGEEDALISKLDPGLELAGIKISGGGLFYHQPDETIDILVHFREGDLERIIDLEGRIGISTGYHFRSLDVICMSCPASSIPFLSRLEYVTYIEWDAPGKFDMDVSTGVVMAPQVWSSLIKRGSSYRPGPDGEGIGIAVVDSGIDAGHPDLDHGYKTVKNIKAVRAGDPWVDMENTDTSIGHGSHCAGIAAGNGEASAGSRRGVAPEADLIGLSLTEGDEEISTSNYLYGLEWVFENSKPSSNPYNIKVCTNSWHTTVGEYDPEMALSKIINKLTYENNVVCTFSAGNDGRLDPEGETVWTSQQGNVPGAIMVAAYARDGSYVADFTSHGQVGLNHTYADVGAPGVRIWAAHARRTVISGGSKAGGNPNPYYLAISGTSMSTPHVAGAVALLWEVCPSMDVSRWAEDYNGTDPQWFHSHDRRFVHDSELILESSATPLPYIDGEGASTGIFVEDHSTGWQDRPIDYVQGYGMIDVERAVGIALTLEELRARYRSRYIDVFTALRVYDGMMDLNFTDPGNMLLSSWDGEYSRFNDQNGKPLVVQNQTKHVYIPQGASSLKITIEYDMASLSRTYVGGITVDVDTDMDGSPDVEGGIPIISRPGTYDIPISGVGRYYAVTVRGQGIKLIRPLTDTSYAELRIPYTMRVEVGLGNDGTIIPRSVFSSPINAFPSPASDIQGGNTTLGLRIYDLNSIADPFLEEELQGEEERENYWILWIIIIVSASGVALFIYKRRWARLDKGLSK